MSRPAVLQFALRLCRKILLPLFIIGVAGVLVGAVAFHDALYNRFVHFPRLARAWAALGAQREAVTLDDGWTEFRGICHSHSELSHDSEVPFPEVLAAAKEARLEFLLMSDHCTDGVADFSLQWRGLHDGILFVPGFETSNGLLLWGLPPEARIACTGDAAEVARTVHEQGGTVFFAHTEQERPYDATGVSGMEIYNIHTDLKDEAMRTILGNTAFSLFEYPDQSLYLIFDRQEQILALWDRLNQTGHWTGIAANDAHQNVGVRARYGGGGKINLHSASGELMRSFDWGWIGRMLLKALPGVPAVNEELFRLQLDPYARSLRFVNTHVLARELTETALLEALRAGRVFIGFDMIADSAGFTFYAKTGPQLTVMGEEIPSTEETRLLAASPIPCRFRLMKDGQLEAEIEGREAAWTPSGPGKYRVEALVKVLDAWAPWVYTNPITLTASG